MVEADARLRQQAEEGSQLTEQCSNFEKEREEWRRLETSLRTLVKVMGVTFWLHLPLPCSRRVDVTCVVVAIADPVTAVHSQCMPARVCTNPLAQGLEADKDQLLQDLDAENENTAAVDNELRQKVSFAQ